MSDKKEEKKKKKKDKDDEPRTVTISSGPILRNPNSDALIVLVQNPTNENQEARVSVVDAGSTAQTELPKRAFIGNERVSDDFRTQFDETGEAILQPPPRPLVVRIPPQQTLRVRTTPVPVGTIRPIEIFFVRVTGSPGLRVSIWGVNQDGVIQVGNAFILPPAND